MVRTNPASPDSPHKYYRLAAESETPPLAAPQAFYSVRWSSNAVSGPATWDAHLSWPVAANTNVTGYDVQASGGPVPYNYGRIIVGRESTNVVIPKISVTPHELTVTPISVLPAPSLHRSITPPTVARHVAPLSLATNTWSANLNWSPAVDIAGQRLYCDVEPGGRRQQLYLPPLENRQRLGGLTNGQQYWLELVSVSASGAESRPIRRSLSVEIKE